jgi:hypothetical protein
MIPFVVRFENSFNTADDAFIGTPLCSLTYSGNLDGVCTHPCTYSGCDDHLKVLQGPIDPGSRDQKDVVLKSLIKNPIRREKYVPRQYHATSD